jgi:hypothetical protein
MAQTLIFVHTIPPLVDFFSRLAEKHLTGVTVYHVLDEPLLAKVKRQGKILPEDAERMQAHIHLGENIGVAAGLVTCSTLSPGVDLIRAGIPVYKIDKAMIEQAVAQANRIGVIATSQSTIEPTMRLLNNQAEIQGKKINITTHVAENAIQAYLSGNVLLHDQLVHAAVATLAPQVDLIILAQASSARAMATMPPQEIPILTSPETALEEISKYLQKVT